jgi:hypothetical protein
VPNDKHERSKTIGETGVLEHAPNDVGHLAHRKPGMRAEGGCGWLSIEHEAGSRSGDGRPMHVLPA